jgi:hypothetical protein
MKRILLTVAVFVSLLLGSLATPTTAHARPWGYRGGYYGGYRGGYYGYRPYNGGYYNYGYRPYYNSYPGYNTYYRGYAEQIGDLTTLRLLHGLTESDSLATGPAAWGSLRSALARLKQWTRRFTGGASRWRRGYSALLRVRVT